MEKFRGFVQWIFYPKNGLDKNKNLQRCGFNIKTQKKTVRCFGTVPQIQIGDYFELQGEWDGETTFQVKHLIRVDDDCRGATSMLIFCFGPKTAQNIIHAIDDNAMKAWDLFKNHPDRFIAQMDRVKGVGAKKLEKAFDKYETHIAVDVLFEKFAPFGLSLNQALSIYDVWGNKSMDKINKNPYSLMSLKKIPFQVIDRIGLEAFELSKENIQRLRAGIMSVMYSLNNRGHDFIRLSHPSNSEKLTLIDTASHILHVDKTLVREAVFDEIDNGSLMLDKQGLFDIVYLPLMYKAEKGVAQHVVGMLAQNGVSQEKVEKMIEEYEDEKHFKLAEKQKEAIRTSVRNRFSIISGPPGSGKTTIIDCITKILQGLDPEIKIQLAAPTGKAAKRMSESTGMDAETVHRLLKFSPQTHDFTYNENNHLEADVLIIDEFSMMSIELTYQFLKAVPGNCMVIFVGDKNQLPSVDSGNVLGDLLEVEFIPKVILNEIYRQGKDSTILQRALDMSNDKMPDLSDSKDFTFWEERNVQDLQTGVLNLYFNECKTYGIENVMFLTPMNKYELGVNTLNEIIQDTVNPYVKGRPQIKVGKRFFRLNDRVVQLTNEDDFGVYNGMVGTIVDITLEDKDLDVKDSITVDYGNVQCEYTRERFENIKLAYALTIHKSQGSEAQSVIMICHSSHRHMLTKKLIYTGMTRAKKHLHLVGEKSMVKHALTVQEPPRNSRLAYWCRQCV